MKEKLLWATIAALGAILATSHAQSTAPTPTVGLGRFQIVATERVSATGLKGPVVMRLDTQTGEVWTYQEGAVESGPKADSKTYRYGYWRKVDSALVLYDIGIEADKATFAYKPDSK